MVDAGPHLDSDNVSLSFPASQVRPRRGPAVATDQSPLFSLLLIVLLVVDVVACVIDVVWPFWSLLLVCLLLSLFHGQIIRASTRICDPSYFKLLHLWALIIFQSSRVTEPTHPPVFIAPRILLYPKMGFLYINRRYLPIFDSFLLVVESNINRFWNGFHSRIAYSKLYNIAAQSLSRHKLRCMKIIIETFLGGNSVSVR